MTFSTSFTPFIKKIKTRRYAYIYDVHSNQLIKVTPIIYDLIDFIPHTPLDLLITRFQDRYHPDDIRDTYTEILGVQKEAFFFSLQRPEINCCLPFNDEFKTFHESNLNQLVLELTESCTMCCRYCSISGPYSHPPRHSAKQMPLETALKAVDFFTARCRQSEPDHPPAITFYGGEPLLRLDLIEAVVAHIKKQGLRDSFKFSFTTNGTLLTTATVAKLAENNISILISLDGPQRIHDRYRRYINNEPTFATIVKNLKAIKKNHPAYFAQKIAFNAVVAPPYDFNAIIRFFYKNEFLAQLRDKLMLNFVNETDTTFFKDFNLEGERENLQPALNKLKRRYLRALTRGTYDQLTIEKQLFLKSYHTVATRSIEPLGSYYPAQGACIPGQRRLFVNTAGDFFMCERVGSNRPIGNVQRGFDYQRLFQYLQQYDDFFKNCADCWALRLCRKCFNDIRKGADFDETARETLCRHQLAKIEDHLITYAKTLEKNSRAFLIFEQITVI